MRCIIFAAACALLTFAAFQKEAAAKQLCVIVAEAESGRLLASEGDCETRVTPASTFKVALAIMGYDAGALTDERSPVLPVRDGYADWGGAEWRKAADPARWMKYSIIWYSRLTARQIGAARIKRYLRSFGYGNADFSGDPGKNNALDRAWVSSSLKISPREQVAFLRQLVNRELPVAPEVHDRVGRIIESVAAGDGWTIAGKTGSAYPYRADGSFDRKHAWGWFVGWASRGGTTLVFARLDEVDSTAVGPGGLHVRRLFLDSWRNMSKAAGY